MELNITNPHCFTCQTEELLIELLGGVRIDTLDRMRVTMKITVVNRKHAAYLNNPELAGLSIRHNLDLYNDMQVEKFIRRVAEKLDSDYHMLGRLLPHSLCDVHILVLYILPCLCF